MEQFGKNFFFRGTFVELLGLVFNKLCINMGTSWEKLFFSWEKVLEKSRGKLPEIEKKLLEIENKLLEIENKLLEMEKKVWRWGSFEYNSRKIKKDLRC